MRTKVYLNLQNKNKKQKQKPNDELEDLVTTVDINGVFGIRYETNCTNILHTITQIIYYLLPSFSVKNLPGRHNEALIRKSKYLLLEAISL